MMNISTAEAPTTSAPTSGASNSEDFQPQTRNPQTAPTNLQPGYVPQSGTNQELLDSSSYRISVPSNGNAAYQPASIPSGGINWWFVVIASIVIVCVIEYLIRSKDKAASTARTAVRPVVEPPDDAFTATKEVATNKPKQKQPKKGKKKVSKAKRK